MKPRLSVPDENESAEGLLDRLEEQIGQEARYEILGEFARGGMGAILRVRDRRLGRMLAMKVVLGQGEATRKGDTPAVDARTLDKFLKEAQVTGQLDHPGIVPVHDLGLDDDRQIYFTMKLVKGRDLEEIFKLVQAGDEDWTQTRVLGVILRVCEAMSYAHSKKVLHRDLKPANVMVGRFGEVYVMDWGLAHVEGQEDRCDIRVRPPDSMSQVRVQTDRGGDAGTDSPLITMDGDVLGTPAFMSPEQARGDIEAMGPAADVYSLGAMLYQLLVGHMPYVPSDVRVNAYAVWALSQQGPPTPVAKLAPRAQGELVAICERAMAREPERRYADTGALADDLRAYLEGRVVASFETGAWAATKKWVRRNRALALSLGATLVVLVTALTVILAVWVWGDSVRVRAADALDPRALASRLGAGEAPPPGDYRFMRLVVGARRTAFVIDYAGPRERFEIVLENRVDGVTESSVIFTQDFGSFGVRTEGDTTFFHEAAPLTQSRQVFALERHNLDPALPTGENTFAILHIFLPEDPDRTTFHQAFFRQASSGESRGHGKGESVSGRLDAQLRRDSEGVELWAGQIYDQRDGATEAYSAVESTLWFRFVE